MRYVMIVTLAVLASTGCAAKKQSATKAQLYYKFDKATFTASTKCSATKRPDWLLCNNVEAHTTGVQVVKGTE
jgi:hypothetical protein